MIQISICDDCPVERSVLLQAIKEYGETHKLQIGCTEYICGEALLRAFHSAAQFDLIFLDIYMDGLSGIETARQLRRYDAQVPIVFLTSSPDFALEGYDVRAFDYLLKPMEQRRFQKTMDLFLQTYAKEQSESMLLHMRGASTRILHKDILYIECQHNDLFIHCTNGHIHRLRGSLTQLSEKLSDCSNFLRTHQSFMVNLDHVCSVGDDFVLSSGEHVPIKVRARKQIRELYHLYVLGSASL